MIITRDDAFRGGAIAYVFTINGQPVAEIMIKEKMVLYLKEGNYLFGVIPALNPFGMHSLTEFDINIRRDDRNTFRISVPPEGMPLIQKSSQI